MDEELVYEETKKEKDTDNYYNDDPWEGYGESTGEEEFKEEE